MVYNLVYVYTYLIFYLYIKIHKQAYVTLCTDKITRINITTAYSHICYIIYLYDGHLEYKNILTLTIVQLHDGHIGLHTHTRARAHTHPPTHTHTHTHTDTHTSCTAILQNPTCNCTAIW